MMYAIHSMHIGSHPGLKAVPWSKLLHILIRVEVYTNLPLLLTHTESNDLRGQTQEGRAVEDSCRPNELTAVFQAW